MSFSSRDKISPDKVAFYFNLLSETYGWFATYSDQSGASY